LTAVLHSRMLSFREEGRDRRAREGNDENPYQA
jgi:hypothetical protein